MFSFSSVNVKSFLEIGALASGFSFTSSSSFTSPTTGATEGGASRGTGGAERERLERKVRFLRGRNMGVMLPLAVRGGDTATTGAGTVSLSGATSSSAALFKSGADARLDNEFTGDLGGM